MMLQRDKNIAVWGRGENGRTVSVSINGVSRRGIVRDGEWNVTLPPMAAGGDYEMTVTDGTDTVTFYRVAIGEVWLCGGQSNMELELQNAKGGKEILETLTPDCGVRFYYTQKNGYKNEKFYHDEENSAWSQAGREQSRAWSAVGFHFGVKLAKAIPRRCPPRPSAGAGRSRPGWRPAGRTAGRASAPRQAPGWTGRLSKPTAG